MMKTSSKAEKAANITYPEQQTSPKEEIATHIVFSKMETCPNTETATPITCLDKNNTSPEAATATHITCSDKNNTSPEAATATHISCSKQKKSTHNVICTAISKNRNASGGRSSSRSSYSTNTRNAVTPTSPQFLNTNGDVTTIRPSKLFNTTRDTTASHTHSSSSSSLPSTGKTNADTPTSPPPCPILNTDPPTIRIRPSKLVNTIPDTTASHTSSLSSLATTGKPNADTPTTPPPCPIINRDATTIRIRPSKLVDAIPDTTASHTSSLSSIPGTGKTNVATPTSPPPCPIINSDPPTIRIRASKLFNAIPDTTASHTSSLSSLSCTGKPNADTPTTPPPCPIINKDATTIRLSKLFNTIRDSTDSSHHSSSSSSTSLSTSNTSNRRATVSPTPCHIADKAATAAGPSELFKFKIRNTNATCNSSSGGDASGNANAARKVLVIKNAQSFKRPLSTVKEMPNNMKGKPAWKPGPHNPGGDKLDIVSRDGSVSILRDGHNRMPRNAGEVKFQSYLHARMSVDMEDFGFSSNDETIKLFECMPKGFNYYGTAGPPRIVQDHKDSEKVIRELAIKKEQLLYHDVPMEIRVDKLTRTQLSLQRTIHRFDNFVGEMDRKKARAIMHSKKFRAATRDLKVEVRVLNRTLKAMKEKRTFLEASVARYQMIDSFLESLLVATGNEHFPQVMCRHEALQSTNRFLLKKYVTQIQREDELRETNMALETHLAEQKLHLRNEKDDLAKQLQGLQEQNRDTLSNLESQDSAYADKMCVHSNVVEALENMVHNIVLQRPKAIKYFGERSTNSNPCDLMASIGHVMETYAYIVDGYYNKPVDRKMGLSSIASDRKARLSFTTSTTM